MLNVPKTTVRLDSTDNVVTAVRGLNKGERVEGANLQDDVPAGHKVATAAVEVGEPLIKYAQVIGYASELIKPGQHVHVHNVAFRNTEHDYEFSTNVQPVTPLPENERATFEGFRRPNGKVGTRNFIGVLTSVNCSATAARTIAQAFGPDQMAHFPNVDGVAAFVHGTGCGLADSGDGFAALQRVLWGYARHPNFAGIVLVGLG